ncbi:MAG: PD40 domain-containing protein [Planctomycetes bacterium]|nr:PD40 domain-containing protein [Planctomycetota bacterium]
MRLTFPLLAAVAAACTAEPPRLQEPLVPAKPLVVAAGKPVANLPGERFFRSVRQLTFGGENAEAYWSWDGTRLILQSRPTPTECDQIYVLDLRTGTRTLVSTGKGVTTCGYFLQGDKRVIFASTHVADEKCPPPPGRVRGRYVWAVRQGYDLFTARPDGTDLKRLTDVPGYDAEATVCPVTGRILFTSVRDGDLELYVMEQDGSEVRRITNRVGYDGGAFFSHDGSKIVLRSGLLETPEQEKEYKDFLAQGLVVPSRMELAVCAHDGKGFRTITNNGKANFAPFWHPDNRRILFSSNQDDPRGRNFELYLIDETGKNQVRVTNYEQFDGFPMFSPDGRHLVFASNRFGTIQGETNIFLAEWAEQGDVVTPASQPSRQ